MPARRLGWIAALLALSLSTAMAMATAGAATGCRLVMFPQIPVKMDNLRPVITANINGVDARFIVDTGSFFDFLSPAAAAQFKLPLQYAPPYYYVNGIGGSFIPKIATAKVFTVAGITAHDAEFLVGNNDFQGSEVGILGQNIFRIADVDYDFANGVLRFAKPEHCDGKVLAYWAGNLPIGVVDLHWTSERRPHLTGKASVNGHEIEVLFDTGSPRAILSLSAAKRAGITPASPGVVAAGITVGMGKNTIKVWIAPVAKFEIGGETIEHTRVLIGDINVAQLGADMLLGSDFFLAHHMYVAYSQNKLYFTYNGGPVFDLNASRPAQTAGGTQQTPASHTPAITPPADTAPQPGTSAQSGRTPQSSGPAAAPAAPASQQAVPIPVSDTPTDAAGFMRRGMADSSRHEYSEAIADLTRACNLDVTNADCRYQRGLAYWHSTQPQLALADFNAAIQLQPNDFEAHLSRAQLELQQHPADAQTDLDAVDRLAPQQADLRLALAGLYEAAAEYAGAVHQYDLWIEYHPDDIRLSYALSNRCGSEAAADVDLDRAIDDCNTALHRMSKAAPAPATALALSNRGLVYLRLRKLDSALADFDAALKLQPQFPLARYGRGLAELEKGLSAVGQADMAAAQASKPDLAKRLAAVGLKP